MTIQQLLIIVGLLTILACIIMWISSLVGGDE